MVFMASQSTTQANHFFFITLKAFVIWIIGACQGIGFFQRVEVELLRVGGRKSKEGANKGRDLKFFFSSEYFCESEDIVEDSLADLAVSFLDIDEDIRDFFQDKG